AVWPIKTVWHEITYYDSTYVPESKDESIVHTYTSATEAYEKGVEYLEEDSIDFAIEAFSQAVKMDKKFIEAHHQMGLAYLEKNTIYYRRKAVKSLREALFWNRKNFEIQLDLGKAYLMQRFRYNAKKKFTWLKKTDPNNIELLLSLGKLYKEDVEYYQNMVDVFTDDAGVLSFVDQDLLTSIFTYDGPEQVKNFCGTGMSLTRNFRIFPVI
ncbi:tetratricopeptide repeat protein, partial [candidate division KSB1 bacterium]